MLFAINANIHNVDNDFEILELPDEYILLKMYLWGYEQY